MYNVRMSGGVNDGFTNTRNQQGDERRVTGFGYKDVSSGVTASAK